MRGWTWRWPDGVTDGTRTRDIQGHNLTLCQLSYGHHRTINRFEYAPPREKSIRF